MAYAEDAENLVRLTHEGLRFPTMLAGINEIFLEMAPDDEEMQERIANLRKKEKLAEAEASAEFPTLHAHTILGLWGALECFITDLAIGLLLDRPQPLDDQRLSKVRVPVRVFAHDPREAMATIVEEIAKQSGAVLSNGTSRFESILDHVGLDDDTPKKVKNAVYAAQHVRNVWAHRGGIADRRFVDACPHLGFEAGQSVAIGHELYRYLKNGILLYGYVVIRRVFLRYDLKTIELPGLDKFPEDAPRRGESETSPTAAESTERT